MIVPIVEGHGEVQAIRILIERIASTLECVHYAEIGSPLRVGRDKLMRRADEVERYVNLAATKGGSEGRILILLDADGDRLIGLAFGAKRLGLLDIKQSGAIVEISFSSLFEQVDGVER